MPYHTYPSPSRKRKISNFKHWSPEYPSDVDTYILILFSDYWIQISSFHMHHYYTIYRTLFHLVKSDFSLSDKHKILSSLIINSKDCFEIVFLNPPSATKWQLPLFLWFSYNFICNSHLICSSCIKQDWLEGSFCFRPIPLSFEKLVDIHKGFCGFGVLVFIVLSL